MTEKEKSAALIIQKYLRGYSARKIFNELLTEKILTVSFAQIFYFQEEEERYEKEKRRLESGLKEFDYQLSRST